MVNNPGKVSFLRDQGEIIREIHELVRYAENIEASLPELIENLKIYFDCKAVTIFGVDPSRHQLYSINYISDRVPEIRVGISLKNLAGYVAGTGNSLNIANVEDKEALAQYHPQLAHESKWEEIFEFTTTSMIVVPISYNQSLIGILEVINKISDDAFSDQDLHMAQKIAPVLGLALARFHKDNLQKSNSIEEALAESNNSPNTEHDTITKQNVDRQSENRRNADRRNVDRRDSDKAEEIPKQKPTKFSYLIDNNLITEKILSSSLDQAKSGHVDVEMVLMDSVGLKRKQLGLSLENFYNLPYYGFDKSIILPQKILGGLNKNFLSKNYWIPIHSDNSKVVILINDPNDLYKIQNIKHIFPKKKIEFKIGLKVDIIDFFNSILEQEGNYLAPVKPEEMSSLLNNLQEEGEETLLVTNINEEVSDSSDINEGDSGIIRLVNKVLMDAYDSGVTDIHIEPGLGKDNILIRFRKDGECEIYEKIPFLYKHAIISRIKIIAQLDITERRIPQDGKFKIRYGKDDIEFRVATCPTVGGNEDIVLRILAKYDHLTLDKMNFSEQNLQLIHKSLAKPYGLILVVGPTGSGKTTTLHSCLGSLNTPKKKIWTVEDPVEITQKGIRQVQTIEKKGLNFARAMRSFLRGDPDVIMVGEMRDTETASVGLEASLTGHLVFSTLHTNSAPETITRLLDMGMNPLNFADALILIVAQRLIKTLCANCREDYHPTQEEFDTLVKEYGEEQFQKLGVSYDNDLTLKKPVGCEFCNDSGYAGRTAIHELLEGTPAVKRMVVKQASAGELRTRAIEDGMSTLKQDGIQKIFKGDCDLKQVLAVCII